VLNKKGAQGEKQKQGPVLFFGGEIFFLTFFGGCIFIFVALRLTPLFFCV